MSAKNEPKARVHLALIVLFPMILVAFEGGIRFLMQQDFVAFVGPTLCVAGLSFLVPLTRVTIKEIPADPATGISATYNDSEFVAFINLMLFIYMFLWGASIYLSIKHSDVGIFQVPVHAIIGFILYVLSVIFTVYKDRS